MKKYFSSSIGRLRVYALLEGVSLLALLFIAMPIKYMLNDPSWVKLIGPIHGALFVLFIYAGINVGIEYKWKFWKTTWLLLVASFIPFGTFYLDHTLLKPLHKSKLAAE